METVALRNKHPALEKDLISVSPLLSNPQVYFKPFQSLSKGIERVYHQYGCLGDVYCHVPCRKVIMLCLYGRYWLAALASEPVEVSLSSSVKVPFSRLFVLTVNSCVK